MSEPSQPRSHSIQNTLIAAAIVAEFVLVIGHPLFGWGNKTYTATPQPLVYEHPQPPSGTQVLLALGVSAARQPVPRVTSRTPYAYVNRQEWHLGAPTTGHPPPSQVAPR